MRILEIVFIFLVLQAAISMVLRLLRNKSPSQRRTSQKRFDEKGKDIVDGDYKEIK